VRRYGDIGDWFPVKYDDWSPREQNHQVSKVFTLTDLVKTIAELVAEFAYEYEGFDTSQEFRDYYIMIKNKTRERYDRAQVKYNPDEKVTVHWYGVNGMKPALKRKLELSSIDVRTSRKSEQQG
jgi:hypothetical protein